MRFFLLLSICCMFFCKVNAQVFRGNDPFASFDGTEKYVTFNPFAVAEPQMAIGGGFGNRFTERSEYFAELSYILKQPFYDAQPQNVKLNGYRFIAQYRYHFLQKWKPLINLGQNIRKRNARHNPFVAVECRIKRLTYPVEKVFVNNSSMDTLPNMPYDCKNFTMGAALVFGETYRINEHWKIEFSIGFGGKEKTIRYKNVPEGYEEIKERRLDGFSPFNINNYGSIPYFPCAIRLKYCFKE